MHEVSNLNIAYSEISIKISTAPKNEALKFTGIADLKSILFIKEYINTLPKARKIVKNKDIESNLEQLSKGEKILDSHLEHVEDSIGETITITFTIALKNSSGKELKTLMIIKDIPEEFMHPAIVDTTQGFAEILRPRLIWHIRTLESQRKAILKFKLRIKLETTELRNTGPISMLYCQ